MISTPPPMKALVLSNARSRGVLTAVRALGRAGWQVGVGTPDGTGMVTASRWVTDVHVVARPRGDCRAFLADTRTALRRGDYPLVFGGGDDWVAALADHAHLFDAAVAHPDADVVARALDKEVLVRLADKVGLAAPRTEVADAAARSVWTGPVIVKCRAHLPPDAESQHRLEARVFPDIATALPRVREIRGAGLDVVLQEPVPGRLCALVGVFDGRRLHGRVQQVSPGLWPTPSGVSAWAETVPVDADLVARSEALLAELGWTGLVELQFVRPPGGVPHLIDCNGRFYGSMALAVAAGANLPDAWGRQVLGLGLPELPDATPGVRYQWAAGDLRRAVVERRGGLLRDVSATLGRVVSPGTASVWDRDDLGPVLNLAGGRLRRLPRGRS